MTKIVCPIVGTSGGAGIAEIAENILNNPTIHLGTHHLVSATIGGLLFMYLAKDVDKPGYIGEH